MKIGTKVMIGILFFGSCYESLYNKNYKDAHNLLLVILIVFLVWQNERKK